MQLLAAGLHTDLDTDLGDRGVMGTRDDQLRDACARPALDSSISCVHLTGRFYQAHSYTRLTGSMHPLTRRFCPNQSVLGIVLALTLQGVPYWSVSGSRSTCSTLVRTCSMSTTSGLVPTFTRLSSAIAFECIVLIQCPRFLHESCREGRQCGLACSCDRSLTKVGENVHARLCACCVSPEDEEMQPA
eukprot:907899-Rhodomonas_salina.2